MLDLYALAQQCSPHVAPETVVAVARVESSFNPYAIGVVGGALKRQPTNKAEALATVRELLRQGRNFSVGITQVNRYNLPKFSMTYEQAFDPCQNMRVGGKILQECYARAMPIHGHPQRALRAAFSCYYSGNFIRGFRPDSPGKPSYVAKVVAAAMNRAPATVQVPRILPGMESVETAGAPSTAPAAKSRPPRSVLLNESARPEFSAEPADSEEKPAITADEPVKPQRVAPVNEAGHEARPLESATATKVVF